METEQTNLTKTERNQISKERTQDLQKHLSELLWLTLTYALNYLELVAVQQPEKLAKEFNNSFEPFDWVRNVIIILAEGRRSFSNGIDTRYLAFELRDLFYCLSLEAQTKLREQGVYYDTFVEPTATEEDDEVKIKNSKVSLLWEFP